MMERTESNAVARKILEVYRYRFGRLSAGRLSAPNNRPIIGRYRLMGFPLFVEW